MCFLLEMAQWADYCITVCCKWIFDSNLKLVLPLTRAWLNYICSGNDTDKIEFPKKIKYERGVINCRQYRIHHYQHCSNLLLPNIHHG